MVSVSLALRSRLSRPCYDKPHRCPGWAGGGMSSAETDRCDNGSIRVPHRDEAEAFLAALGGTLGGYPADHPFRFGRCTTCDIITLPWATRRLDPTYWWAEVRWQARKTRWAFENLLRRR